MHFPKRILIYYYSILNSVCCFTIINGEQQYLFTSGYSSQIGVYKFDNQIGLANNNEGWTVVDAEEANLTFAAFNQQLNTIYLSHEVDFHPDSGIGGAASRWIFVTNQKGELTMEKLQTVSSLGQGTCHIALDTANGLLHLSNYWAGVFTSYKVDPDSGEILDLAYTENYGSGSGVFPDRQHHAHAHGAFMNGPATFYVSDLGSDKIWHYRVDKESGQISKGNPEFTSTPAGLGPRHLSILNESTMYVDFELDSFLGIYDVNNTSGELKFRKLVALLPEGNKWPTEAASEIDIHPSKKMLYVSNRYGTNGIICFEILPNGDLEMVEIRYMGGLNPRHFTIHPSGKFMAVALQDTNQIEIYCLDQETGRIQTKLQQLDTIDEPAVVLFLNLYLKVYL